MTEKGFNNRYGSCAFLLLFKKRKSVSVFTIFVLLKKQLIYMKHLLSALVALTLFISCGKNKEETNEVTTEATTEVPTDNAAKNDKEINDYITKNNLKAQKTDSGLYYVINEPGTGAQPTETSNVTVAYKGYFTDGNVFDQSGPEGISFGLDQVIKGWTEGIPHFKAGGSGIILVPSQLGYGDDTTGPIPGGSTIIFDVKLISVN
jgi:FKBP-type peptidyl-prolyl cis-trans isomerase